MKAIIRIHIWIGLFACSLIGLAQENPSAATTNTPPGGTPAAPAATVPAVGAVIPLIQYVDVPLTTAIENLARQAGINYILDYKVPFGQVGPDGRPQPQPSLTIRWENLTAEQALGAVLNNYDLQLIEDAKTKISRITRKDPAAPDPLITRIVQLKYSSPSNIVAAVQSVLVDKRSHVVADIRTSQMVVTAPEKELDGVDSLVARLDTQTRQVLIEAKLVETSMNPKTMKGIDWSGTLQGQNFSFGNGVVQQALTIWKAPGDTITYPSGATLTPGSSSSTLLPGLPATTSGGGGTPSGGLIPNGMSLNTLSGLTPNIGFLNADGVHAVLSFLNQSSDTKVLSEPRTVTLDNETATLSVTRASPIINVTAGTANTTGGSQTSYTNLGVILVVTPRISANNYVNLKVAPEVSRIFGRDSRTIGGLLYESDIYDLRKIETHVMIPSGNTLVLGGLMQDEINNSSTKVPVMGDIPVLGYAFRSSSKQRAKSNLLIFITPTIVQETDFQPARSDFLKSSSVREMEPEWSAWDTTKPYDWSKSKKQEPVFDESLASPRAQ